MLANVKVNRETLRELTQEDCAVLSAIYQHRCLNEPLLRQYFYAVADIDIEYPRERIHYLVQKGLLEAIEYGNKYPALFLTTLGVETVKVLTTENKSETRQMMKSAYDLKMNPKNIPHQMALNKFVLEAGARIGDGIQYRYYDEKFMPLASEILMPDGMFEFRDHIVLLEMDMGTERSSHIARKWDNYRAFLESRSPFFHEKGITVFFILENVKGLSRRQKTVWSSIERALIDKIDGDFEVYADSPMALQNILATKMENSTSKLKTGLIPKKFITAHGFSTSKALFKKITSYRFDAYIRKLTSARKVLIQDDRPQEFLLDIWLDGRLSVLHKILYYHDVERVFKTNVGRNIPYLVVVPDERWANRILGLCNARGLHNVFYTTEVRLRGNKFNEAVFQIDEQGTVYHFADMGLKEAMYEYRFKERR